MKAVKARSAAARDRLLAAAARVFARDGLTGATTRAIASEAGVNEVTLFRLFGSKDLLLAAVVGENFGSASVPTRLPAPRWTGDLKADLAAHARRYERLLRQNMPLIRSMIGEIHHHGQHEHQVFKAIFRPLREGLIERLETAVKAGQIRATVNPLILADLFGGMIFTGVLRRASAYSPQLYSMLHYRTAAVELVLQGAGAPARRLEN